MKSPFIDYEINIQFLDAKINQIVEMMGVYIRQKRKIMLIEGQKGDDDIGKQKEPPMLTIKEAFLETGLLDYHLRRLCTDKRIKAINWGRTNYLNKNSIHDFLSEGREVMT